MVNRDEKLRFVNQLCMGIALDIGESIDNGKIPEEWDGHELRVLIAGKSAGAASISEIRKNPHSRRALDYKNVITTTTI